MTINNQFLLEQIVRYLKIFGEISQCEIDALNNSLPNVVSISEQSFSRYSNLPKKFNIYQTHHSIYLIYKLARMLYLEGFESASEKLYLVNRMVNGIDLFYRIEMPENFICGHGLGTVFSRATYGDYLVVFQNSTIGVNRGNYPTIGSKVVIYSNCVVAGSTEIGENSVVSPGTVIVNKKIPPNSIVFGGSGTSLVIKENNKDIINDYFIL